MSLFSKLSDMDTKGFICLIVIEVLITLATIIAGSFMFAHGTSRLQSIKTQVDPLNDFEYLGTSCTIQEIILKSETKEEPDQPSDGSKRQLFVCEDTVSYKFTIGNDSESDTTTTTTYMSRTQRSTRNSVWENNRRRPNELCDGDDLDPYSGTFLEDLTTPFVCPPDGICQIGDMVDCWQPSDYITSNCLDDNSCKNDLKWADCGNDACIKLVDPEYEYDDALSDLGGLRLGGIILLSIGIGLAICFSCCSFSIFVKRRRRDF